VRGKKQKNAFGGADYKHGDSGFTGGRVQRTKKLGDPEQGVRQPEWEAKIEVVTYERKF